MKKFIFSAIAAIGLLLSPSCSDENEALSGSGNEALVSFSVNLADGIQTKADPEISDGTKAKNLVVDVFELNTTTSKYERIDGLRQKHDGAFNDGLTTTVNFNLVKGKTYRFIFWAQAQSVENATTSPYGISDLSKITVDYHAGITNDEDRDAFLGVTTDPITVSGNFTKSVEMTRPFAQLNYLIDAAEYTDAKKAGMDIKKAKVTVARVATQLNPLENSVSEPLDNVTFEVNAFPTDFTASPWKNYITLPKAGVAQVPTSTTQNYYYLASKYFLVYAGDGAADKAGVQANLATTSFKLINSSEEEIANYEFRLSQVPVQRNYRTNIYGNLITSEGEFTVNIVPGFNTEDNNLPQYAAVVNDPDEIADKIAEGATTIIASGDFSLSTVSNDPTVISVPKNYTDQTKDVELTFDFSAVATNSTAIKITYNSEHGDKGPENVNVIASGNVIIELEESHVTLNGAEVPGGVTTYNTVTATTSGTTLVVPNGVTVETLNVKKGNVRIEKGGTVTNITNETGGEINVDLEEGGTLVNIPDVSTTKIIVRRSISTAAGLKAFAAEVNSGKTYAGQTVVLSADIDLSGVEWTPIGPNADASNKFQGTFDGQGHTIRNLKVDQEAAYHAAGLFGALNGIAKDFTIDGATITSISQGNDEGDTDNGTAVVAGSIYNTGSIENVTVKNATVNGNRYVAGIAGYVYGSIKDCTVENSTITSTPDKLIGKYDNGDKAGGIVGYICGESQSLVKGCSVKNLTVTAYRDVAGIAGCARGTVEIENNTVDKVTVIANMLQEGEKTLADANAGKVVGRNLADADLSTNTINNDVTVTIYGIDKDKDVATVGTNDGITYAISKDITTIHLTPGTYIIHADAKDKELTFIGTDDPNDVTVDVVGIGGENCDYGLDSSTVTFKGITITTNSSTYIGYARCKGTYENCVINGTYTLYGESNFKNCTFNVSGDVYNIWTWGATNVEFDRCTFNSDGKALLLFQEGANTVNLTVKKCIFNDKGGLTDKKAAIEIGDASYGAKPIYNVTVSGTTVNGYEINDKGINTGTTLWGNKNSMPEDRLNVTVNGVPVYGVQVY